MAYKTILVQVDDSDACVPRLRTANQLAVRFNAHLIGLYVRRGLKIPTSSEVLDGTGLLEAQKAESKHLEDKAHSVFVDVMTSSTGPVIEWRAEDGIADEVFRLHGAYVDLLILGVHRQRPKTFQVSDEVLIGAGRPALLIPEHYAGRPIGHNVLVAWSANREAARAVNDALPLLSSAERVTIISCNTDSKDQSESPTNLRTHLSRHDISSTEIEVACSQSDIGASLLDKTQELDIDLLVMGAYGHTRLREVVWGGTTDYVLAHMPVPVLMSH